MMRLKNLLAAAAVAAFALIGQARAQTQYQFPTTPWSAYAPAEVQCGLLYGANMNTTADQAIPISVPTGTWMVDTIVVSNPSVSLTTAAGGIYSAASKGGVAIVSSGQSYSALTTNAANATGNALLLTISTAGATTMFQGYAQASRIGTAYLSLTTGQGAAATADVRVYCRPLY